MVKIMHQKTADNSGYVSVTCSIAAPFARFFGKEKNVKIRAKRYRQGLILGCFLK